MFYVLLHYRIMSPAADDGLIFHKDHFPILWEIILEFSF